MNKSGLWIMAFFLLLSTTGIHARDTTTIKGNTMIQLKDQIVEASCGECQFGLAGNSCDLAIRIDGKAYFVDGTHIDDHGDAHADDGFCETVRQARVTGEIINGRFQAVTFDVLPSSETSKGKHK